MLMALSLLGRFQYWGSTECFREQWGWKWLEMHPGALCQALASLGSLEKAGCGENLSHPIQFIAKNKGKVLSWGPVAGFCQRSFQVLWTEFILLSSLNCSTMFECFFRLSQFGLGQKTLGVKHADLICSKPKQYSSDEKEYEFCLFRHKINT